MKSRLILWVLLSLTAPGTVFAGEGHGHDDEGLDDFSDIEMIESHGPHGEEGHQHEKEQHEHQGDGHEEHGHDHGGHDEADDDGHGHGEEVSDVELSETQRRIAGIETMIVTRQSLGGAITAPGEAILNAYRTTKITPRTAAQVIKRHAYLGDHVKKGARLITLSSVEMAEAQGALMEASVELRRVEKLGRKVLSEKRFVAAQIAYQQAYAKVNAYGMTKQQIESLIETGDATRATGEFDLLSFQDGTLISDDFVVGELIEPGYVLMEISDESLLWVEARLTPDDAARIALKSPAQVQVGKRWMSGKVVQARHTLDATTRTLAVHIEVENRNDELHPGQFVNVVIEGNQKRQGLVVPVAAILRSPEGDWQLFVEIAPGRFEPKEVTVLDTVGDRMLIEGIEEGTTIVGKGAFFVQSEMAKGGFDPHNH
ncbi:MAG: efflux RND transporter periplasmic adaptor subunit [Gammaproteobacteria bacterium]|nr:efflux RND transporter periplasmic adaptor subunit [Gammaproteobacteria bacterium]MCF6229973.1 efflux RND transporter periplasmic adaptor subunit [Gammaproteobacteria bacterium]